MSDEYTLPRVMQFLQLEWQRNERDRIQWELERAEMKSRIQKLQGDKAQQDRQLASANRTIEMLQHGESKVENGKIEDSDDQGDLSKLVQARQYLDECVTEVRTLLEQSGISQDAAYQVEDTVCFGARSRLVNTLCNFRGEPTAVCPVLGHLFIIGTDDGNLIVWDLETASYKSVDCGSHVLYIAQTASLDLIYVVCTDSIQSWKLEVPSKKLVQHEYKDASASCGAIKAAAYLQQSNQIAVCSAEGAVVLFNLSPLLASDRTIRFFPDSLGIVPTSVTFEPESNKLLIGYNDGGLLLADPQTSQLVKRIHTPPAQVQLTKVPPAVYTMVVLENTVITGHATGDLRVYDLTRGQLKEEVTAAHSRAITSLCVSPDKSSIVSTSEDGCVSLWTINLGTLSWYGRLLSHDALESGGATTSTWSDNNLIAIGAGDGLVRAYSMV